MNMYSVKYILALQIYLILQRFYFNYILSIYVNFLF
jgi:hypothetical protein